MKKYLLTLILFSCLISNSQNLILTKAFNEPIVGDTNRTYIIDTTAYLSGLNVALTGSNTVWTYTNLAATAAVVTSAYLDPTAVPSASSYVGCNVVQKQGTLFSFYKSAATPSVQTEFIGVYSTSLTMNFTNTAVSARYPFTFGNSFTDSFSGAFTFSISGTASGNATVTADGAGVLILPSGTYSNVLRVKSVQTTNLNAIIINGTIKQTNYSFYHASQKFPILNINYQTITVSGSPTISAQVTGNKNNFVIGVKENSLTNLNESLFPNPAKDVFTITLNNNSNQHGSVEIYNVIGQLVKTVNIGNAPYIEQTISIQGLKSGVYTVKTILGNRNSSKKLIIE